MQDEGECPARFGPDAGQDHRKPFPHHGGLAGVGDGSAIRRLKTLCTGNQVPGLRSRMCVDWRPLARWNDGFQVPSGVLPVHSVREWSYDGNRLATCGMPVTRRDREEPDLVKRLD